MKKKHLGSLFLRDLLIDNSIGQTKYNFTSDRQDYLTHPRLIGHILKKLNTDYFSVDTCCSQDNVKAVIRYKEGEKDGLTETWKPILGQNWWAYCNPPYKECSKWVKKAYEEQQNGANSVLLIPVRTETDYWHKYILFNKNIEIEWLKKGWKFLNPETKEEMGVFKNALAIVYFKGGGNE